MATNRNNLGPKVTTRTINWMDQVSRAWGSELHAPDRGVYEFGNRRKFDSTDQGRTGLYGIDVPDDLIIDGGQYPDMRDGVLLDIPGSPPGSRNNGFGAYDNIAADYNSLTAVPDPVIPYTDPYFNQVVLLLHGDEYLDRSQYGITMTPSGAVSIDTNPLSALFGVPVYLCDTIAIGGGALRTPSSTRYNQTAGEPYTVEWWMQIIQPPPLASSCQFMYTSDGVKGSNMGNPGGPQWSAEGVGTFSSVPALGTWRSFAATFDGVTNRRFCNGILTAEQNGIHSTTPGSYFWDIVGSPSGGVNVMRGRFAEIRVTRGVARYAVNYPVQTRPWPNQGPT